MIDYYSVFSLISIYILSNNYTKLPQIWLQKCEALILNNNMWAFWKDQELFLNAIRVPLPF